MNTSAVPIPGIAGVRGVLALPHLGRVYTPATDGRQLVVIDERTLFLLARVPAGLYPDGLAHDPLLNGSCRRSITLTWLQSRSCTVEYSAATMLA